MRCAARDRACLFSAPAFGPSASPHSIFSDPRVIALLNIHLTSARAETAPGSAHALDLSGLQSPDISFWAIWDDETLVGIGALRRLSEDHGEVKSMHTAESIRGRGAGSTMLRHIIATARASGMSRLSLETGSWDYFQLARALYRSHGFVECAPFGDYSPDANSVFIVERLEHQLGAQIGLHRPADDAPAEQSDVIMRAATSSAAPTGYTGATGHTAATGPRFIITPRT